MSAGSAPQYGRQESAIEATFARDLRAMKVPAPTRNVVFLEGRKFELDFAWPAWKCAVEIDGHVHRIRDRFDTDREKGALAILDGWTVMHVTGMHVRDGRAVEWTLRMLALKGVFPYPVNASKAPPPSISPETLQSLSDDADAACRNSP